MHYLKAKIATEKYKEDRNSIHNFILTYSDIIGQPCREKVPVTSLDSQSI